MSAWVKQIASQVAKHGEKNASWYCFWYEPDGTRRNKSCGPGKDGKKTAQLLAEKTKAQLKLGEYENDKRLKKTWKEFREEYESFLASRKSAGHVTATRYALNNFERVAKPKLMKNITTATIEKYVTARKLERGNKKGSLVSEATINKELRHIRAILKRAAKAKYLPDMPEIEFLREPGKMVAYVTPEHFALMYQNCNAASLPERTNCSTEEWWQALLVFAYMTGWRIGEILAMKRSDLDLEAGTAITRAGDNKGKRDESIPLNAITIEHLKRIVSFGDYVFEWSTNRRNLYVEFLAIQKKAGIDLPCHEDHEHTDACHAYGFHDLRRAFATMNADRLSASALQSLMRHKSYQTTQGYINMANQLKQSADALYVPNILKIPG